jgi:hypothetical protein
MPCAHTDPDCLRKAATHVAHDIRMLREAWHRQADPLAYTSWFTYCRSVMDFFEGVGMKPENDIYAWHYFTKQSDWDNERQKVAKPVQYKEYRDTVNKLTAHLTYSRVDYAATKQLPPSREITEYLLGLGALFLQKLPDQRIAWFGGLSL